MGIQGKSKQKFLKNDCVVAIDTALKNKVSIEEQTSSKESPAFKHGSVKDKKTV